MGWDFYTHSSAMLLIRIREMVSLLCRKMYLTTFWKAKSISVRVRWTRSRIEDIMNKTFFLVVRVIFLGLHLFVEELLWFWLKRWYVWFAWLPPRYLCSSFYTELVRATVTETLSEREGTYVTKATKSHARLQALSVRGTYTE